MPVDPAALHALVVDDEPDLVRVVVGYLEREGFQVRSAGDGESALDLVRAAEPDVVVLDLGLPGIDGVETCRRLRTFSDCYVVMLTARADEVDMLIGLAVGADDYLTKPFSPRELTARIRTLLRRPRQQAATHPAAARRATEPGGEQRARTVRSGPAAGVRVFGDLTMDPQAREVTVGGSPVALTRTEFELLEVLSSRPRMVFTRRQLIDRVWGEGWVGDEHLVDIHLGHVRRKLGDDPAASRYVITVRGVGYRMGQG
ncbi:MAG TPA: response regulator transcription factor [Kineosporiaceae bacterium]